MQTRTRWKHPLFSRYRLIKYHCENENSGRYDQYGGRGIKLKKSWSTDFFAFADWIEQNIGLPTGPQDCLERKNNDGDYKPGNLRWATQKENSRNRTTNTWIKIGRETKTLSEWCEQQGIWIGTVCRRMTVMGVKPEEALEIKPHPRIKSLVRSGKIR